MVVAPVEFQAPDLPPNGHEQPDETTPLAQAWRTIGLWPLPLTTRRQELALERVKTEYAKLIDSNKNQYFRFNVAIAFGTGFIVLYGAAISQLGTTLPVSSSLIRALALLALAGVLDIAALIWSFWALVHHKKSFKYQARRENIGIAALAMDPFDEFESYVRRTIQLGNRAAKRRRHFAAVVLLITLSLAAATAAAGMAALAYPVTATIHLLF